MKGLISMVLLLATALAFGQHSVTTVQHGVGGQTTVVQTTHPSTSTMPAWQQSLQLPVTTTHVTTHEQPATQSTSVTTVETTTHHPHHGTVVNTLPVMVTPTTTTTTTHHTTITPAR